MSTEYVLNAELRADKGRGANRRLRRAGKVPAILYGGGDDPLPIALEHNELIWNLEREAFYSQVLTVKLDGKVEQAILRDLQRHPSKTKVIHLDLQRIRIDQKIRVNVPLHYIGEESAVGVKQQGGTISHLMTEVEVECLPANLPEFINVDISNLQLNESLRLSDLILPNGVEVVELIHGNKHDHVIVTINPLRQGDAVELEAEEGEERPAEGGEATPQ